MVRGTEPAHKILELLIIKALVSGKTRGSTIRLSASELASEMGQTASIDVDLVIKFDLSWDESKDFMDEILRSEDDNGQQ